MVDGIHQIRSGEHFLADLPELEDIKPRLTELEKRFAVFYVLDPKRNASAAVHRAGYECGKNSAYVQASRLLRKAKIREAIDVIQKKFGGEDCLERIEAVLRAQIFTDLCDVMSWGKDGKPSIIPSDQLPPEVSAAIASIEEVQEESQRRMFDDDIDIQVKNIRRRVKLYDKNKAIELYVKIKGWNAPDKVDVSGGITVDILEGARERIIESSPA